MSEESQIWARNEIERLNKEIEDMRKMFDKALDGIYKDLGAISKRV